MRSADRPGVLADRLPAGVTARERSGELVAWVDDPKADEYGGGLASAMARPGGLTGETSGLKRGTELCETKNKQ